MSTKTTNYELVKPALSDPADITAINPNWDKIDAELHSKISLGEDGKIPSSMLPDMNYIPTAEKGVASGVATLGADGKVPANQLSIAAPTGAASTIQNSNLTANRALVSNSNGKIAVSAVTSTELGYLDGVTSNVQTQLNNKLSTSGGTITGPVHVSNPGGSRAITKIRTVGDTTYFMDVGMGVYGGKATTYLRLLRGSDSNGTQLYRLDLTPYGLELQNSSGNVFWYGGSPAATASVEE